MAKETDHYDFKTRWPQDGDNILFQGVPEKRARMLHSKKSEKEKKPKEFLDKLDKAMSGEGSRGGKVIGHTKSGKPIYDDAAHPGHKDFTPEDHKDAAAHHADMSQEIHSRLQGKIHENEAKAKTDKDKSLREKMARRAELTEGKNPNGVHPGVDAHKIKIEPKEKTYVPVEGFNIIGDEEPELKAYKKLAREMLRAGYDVKGHITYDQKTRKIKSLTPKGEQAMHEIAQKFVQAQAGKQNQEKK